MADFTGEFGNTLPNVAYRARNVFMAICLGSPLNRGSRQDTAPGRSPLAVRLNGPKKKQDPGGMLSRGDRGFPPHHKGSAVVTATTVTDPALLERRISVDRLAPYKRAAGDDLEDAEPA